MSGVLVASIGSLYERAIVDTGKEPELLFLVSFLVTFGFIRTSAYMIRAQVSWWPGNVQVGGTHIHHLVWGICTLLIVGYLEIAISPESPWHEYWSEQGRRSIDAVIVMATFAAIMLIGFKAWLDVAKGVEDAIVSVAGSFWFITIALVIVNFTKEKFVTGVVGLFVPVVALAGALRLGRAHSPWAKWFYSDEKKAKAAHRFEREEAPLERIWDRMRGKSTQSPAGSG
jgi:hypothetical protein